MEIFKFSPISPPPLLINNERSLIAHASFPWLADPIESIMSALQQMHVNAAGRGREAPKSETECDAVCGSSEACMCNKDLVEPGVGNRT